MEDLTEVAQVALARKGDRAAFGQLIERHQQMVKQIALNMVGNEETARELAQEALLQAYLSLDHLRNDARFKSWLYGITLNVCRTFARERKVNPYSLEAITGGVSRHITYLSLEAQDPQVIAEERELHRGVLAAVQSLSERERAATLLFYYEQLSMQDIATLLGISVVAVKGRLHRARKQLRERLLPLLTALDGDLSRAQKRIQTGKKEQKEKTEKTMLQVSIAAVLDNFANPNNLVVILLDEEGSRVLTIWIGASEGRVINMALVQAESPRPMTAHFMVNLLKATGIELEEVRIESLTSEVFYATAQFRNGESTIELDARPSDALALAALLDRPVYVAEDVMERASIAIPAGKTIQREKFREDARKRTEQEGSASPLTMPSWPTISREELEQSVQKLVTLLTE